MFLRTAITVARKDLRLFLRDRAALAMAFALPLVLGTIFAAAMAGMAGDDGPPRIELCVEDLDRSETSRKLVAELLAARSLEVLEKPDVRARVAQGKEPAALLIPSGFGADVEAGNPPRLVLYRDPAKELEQQILAGSLIPALFRVAGPALGRSMAAGGMAAFGFPAGMREQAERAFEGDGDVVASGGGDFASRAFDVLGLTVEDVAGGRSGSRKSASQAHAIAGIAVMMLLFGLAACGGTILQERDAGTLERIRLTPSAGPAILIGKLLFTVAVGLGQLTVLFTYGGFVFDVPILRSPAALAVHSLAVALAAAGFGLCLAVLCRTQKQLEGLSTLIILTMSALGGSWFPLAFVPEWFRTIGHFTLNAWAMDGFQGIFWYGKSLSGIALEIGVLLAIAAATTFAAWRGWRARFES